MTAKREAELETENRMLREQVASLEKIIERMQPTVCVDPAKLTQGAAPYPYWHYFYPWVWSSGSTVTVTGGGPDGCTTTLS